MYSQKETVLKVVIIMTLYHQKHVLTINHNLIPQHALSEHAVVSSNPNYQKFKFVN